MTIPGDIKALAARVAALESWVQAFEAGPFGNVPWAERSATPQPPIPGVGGPSRAEKGAGTGKPTSDSF